jgi:hypothetical protein
VVTKKEADEAQALLEICLARLQERENVARLIEEQLQAAKRKLAKESSSPPEKK